MTDDRDLRVVSSTSQIEGEGVVRNVPGNAFDKHRSRNPLIVWLMARFHSAVTTAVGSFRPDSVLDIGCGEGRTTSVLVDSCEADIVGADLEEVVVSEANRNVEKAEFLTASVFELPFRDETFDVVVATEMLEHVDRPVEALEEMRRVSTTAVIVTVPHEPWWRIANVMRGRYLSDLGNTPGHVQHWSPSSLRITLSQVAERVSVSRVGLWLLGTIEK